MKIKVAKIEKKTSRNGKGYYAIYDSEGNYYTTFEKAIGSQMQEGKEYDIDFKENKGFKNISAINLGIISMPEEKTEKEKPKPQGAKDYWAKRNKEIRRLSILKAATDLAIARKQYSESEVLKIAEALEKWVVA